MRILLAEDNSELAAWLMMVLSSAGHALDHAADGIVASQLLESEPYMLAILDVGLPRRDGLEVLRRLRRSGSRLPVLMLTAQCGVGERIAGLDLGADDYLGKPFDVDELKARVRALLRRGQVQQSGQLCCGRLQFDVASRCHRIDGNVLALTPREMAVLEVLLYRQGRPVTKDALAEQVAGLCEDISSDAMEVYIHRLRKKLAGSGVRIQTLRGLGYLLDEDVAAA
ncbi:response regulator [Craterilacuibacter sp. RT1T]|uniref:response regulator n=1 Tax=Craterilacuibacter sp. RT1T TaxID=2942211 RepID=UPI0020BF0C52|nr:response regulator [Craterilacuibacter sp. RT1T]MCL6264162.1 response regulator [Craterilacuibacter sp. RT1T]